MPFCTRTTNFERRILLYPQNVYCTISTITGLGCDRDTPWLLNFNTTEGVGAVTLRFLATHVTPRRRREDFVTLCNRWKLGFLTTIGLCDP